MEGRASKMTRPGISRIRIPAAFRLFIDPTVRHFYLKNVQNTRNSIAGTPCRSMQHFPRLPVRLSVYFGHITQGNFQIKNRLQKMVSCTLSPRFILAFFAAVEKWQRAVIQPFQCCQKIDFLDKSSEAN